MVSDLQRFAEQINRTLYVPDGIETFGEDKYFISSVYDDSFSDEMTLAQFKRLLTEAHREGLIVLSRADLVSAMDPELVARSHAEHLGAEYHFINRSATNAAFRRAVGLPPRKLQERQMRRINNPDYKFYLLIDGKIESGWEYREDAADHKKDNRDGAGKIVAKRTLIQQGIDPNENSSWMTGNMKEGREMAASSRVKKVQEVAQKLRGWMQNHNHDSGFNKLVLQLLASCPGGDELEDMGYDSFEQVGWQEISLIGDMLNVIQDSFDTKEIVDILLADPDNRDEPQFRDIAQAIDDGFSKSDVLEMIDRAEHLDAEEIKKLKAGARKLR